MRVQRSGDERATVARALAARKRVPPKVKLPSNEIGISDILQWRDCPQRFAFGMRRHVELPARLAVYEGERDDPPEAESPQSAYGSCIHDIFHVIDKEAVSDEEAIQRVWPKWAHWLEPDDLDRIRADLETYHKRSLLGYRLVAAEADMRVPLFVYKGEQIYFRFKLDALYQHLQNPAIFVSRDYKSSRWPKSDEEVQKDLQQWAYNWGVFEMFPECEDLTQIYDQLRYGEIPTRKNAEQRASMKEWLIQMVTAILEDETLEPKLNDWCAYCPLLLDCREPVRATEHWKNLMSVIAPVEKVGRKLVVKFDDAMDYDYYVEMLPKVAEARKMLERFEETVKADLMKMSAADRDGYGYTTISKSGTRFPASSLQQIATEFPTEFWHIASITKAAAERMFGKGSDELERVMAYGEKFDMAPYPVKKS